MKELFYYIVLNKLKEHCIMYGSYDKYMNCDYELNRYVLDTVLNNPNIVFTIAKMPIESIEYELNNIKNKETLFVETKIFSFKEFVNYVNNIKENTLFGLHELYAYSSNEIEIRFYQKSIPKEIIGLI